MICLITIREEVNSYVVRNQGEDPVVKEEEEEEDLKEKEVEVEEVEVKVEGREMVSVRASRTDRAKMQGLREDPQGVHHHNTTFPTFHLPLFPSHLFSHCDNHIVYFINLIYHNFI